MLFVRGKGQRFFTYFSSLCSSQKRFTPLNSLMLSNLNVEGNVINEGDVFQRPAHGTVFPVRLFAHAQLVDVSRDP